MSFGMRSGGVVVALVACFAACSDNEACSDGDCGGGDTTSSSVGTPASSGTGTGGAGGQEPLSVTVMVVDSDGEPLATDVIVNAADGSIVTETMSDASGQVMVVIPAEGSVSAYYSYEAYYQGGDHTFNMGQSTFPGDAAPSQIVLRPHVETTEVAPGSSSMNVQANFVADPDAASYQVVTNCDKAAGTASGINLTMDGCTTDGQYDLVLFQFDPYGLMLDYAVLRDAPFMANQTATFQINWVSSPVEAAPYYLTDFPAGVSTVSMLATSTETTHGVPITAQHLISHDGATNDVNGSIGLPLDFGAEHCVLAAVRSGTHWRDKQRCMATPSNDPFDFDVSRLATFDPAGTGWATVATGDLGDEIQLVVGGTEGNTTTQWSARVAPAASGTLVRPEVPPSLSQFVSSQSSSVMHLDFQGVDGFEAALAAPNYDDYEWNFSM